MTSHLDDGYSALRNDADAGSTASVPFAINYEKPPTEPVTCDLISIDHVTIHIDCPDDAPDTLPTSVCEAIDNEDGTHTISCADGTTVTIADGEDGTDGTAGADGEGGSSCTATTDEGGIVTTSCEDGSSATNASGEGGESCSVEANENSSATITCT